MPYYDEHHQTAQQRDATIVELRRRGYSYRTIGKAVGISARGVGYALQRIAEGRPGKPTRQ
jgi:hypothetical protein